jgi:hypothetical protein
MNEMIDCDGQPLNFNYNKKRNRNKTAAMLYGILSGITADQVLNDVELMFLKHWLSIQEEKKGDFLDIYDAIQATTQDGVITADELEDLLNLLNDSIEYTNRIFEDDVKVNELIGYLKGITADGIINPTEFKELIKFMDVDPKLLNLYPFNIVNKRIKSILKDGKVTLSKLADLHDLACDITGTNFTKEGDVLGGATTLFSEKIPHNIYNGDYKVCFTGKFISGKRTEIENQAKAIGLIPQSNVTNETYLIVIGTLSSRDWIHESSGRKIESAIELRNSGKDLIITNERNWIEVIESGV